MTSDGYGYTGTQSQYYSEMPQEVAIYQTPKKALVHSHFIKNAIFGAIGGFLINWGIGALFQLHKDRLFLWHQPKPYFIGTLEVKAGSPLWLEILLTITLSVFLGHPLNAWGAKGDIKKLAAIPIQGHDLAKFRFLGVTIKNSWLRALVFTVYSTLIVFSATMLILFLACDHGGMYRAVIPPEPFAQPGECYMVKKYYILLKGVLAALAGLSICWMQEWAILNRDNIPDEVFEEYTKAKQSQLQLQQPDVNLPNEA